MAALSPRGVLMSRLFFIVMLRTCLGLAFGFFSHCAYSSETNASLYQALGGEEKLKPMVHLFVRKLVGDTRISKYFEGTNLKLLEEHLYEQFCELAQGPCVYHGDPMREVHKGMKLKQADFNALAEDLQDAMQESGIAYSTQNKLIAKLAPMYLDIVTQ